MPDPASQFQKSVARKLGIAIDTDSFAVAAAQIGTAIHPAITGSKEQAKAASNAQVQFAASLGVDVSKDSMKVASARIQERLDERNAKLIETMGLAPGVNVLWKETNREMTISSIASNHRLWFKGGNGYGAFPHEVEPLTKQSGPSGQV